MKRIVWFMFSLFFVLGMPLVGAAEVNINISVPPPPPLVFPAPPDVVVVPSETSDVYLVPNTAGLYFYGGHWYRFYGDHWFRASLYSGPWVTLKIVSGVERSAIPDTIKMSEAAGRSYGDSIEQLRSFEQLIHVVL